MKKRLLKILFISATVILLLLGVFIFTIGYCLERSGITLYSFAYCTCLSQDIMGVPLPGLVNEPLYNATNWSDNGNPEYNGVRFRSNSKEDEIAAEIKTYFTSKGFVLVDDSKEFGKRYFELKKINNTPLLEFNRKGSRVNVSIADNVDNLEIGVYQEYEY